MRSRVVALSVSLLFASLLTASLLAQAQPAAAPKNEPNVPAILATMKSDLRNVVVAEEMFTPRTPSTRTPSATRNSHRAPACT